MPTVWLNSSICPFLLTGFPGLEKVHHLISLPLLMAYISILLGNGTLLFIIKDDHNLHEPMYYFLGMLAATDLGVTLTTMPTVLGVLWLNHREIGHAACFSQAYFIHTLSIVESGVLLAMAYDRFIAIRNPLRYTTILTDTRRLPYHTKYIIHHAYCEHMAVVKLASANTLINRAYGISVALSVITVDLGLIATSYVKILQAVFRLSSQNARSKALGTCAAHVCTMLVSYTPALFSFLTHRIGKKVPPSVHIIVASVYLLLPSAVNPVVYGVKTKQIRDRVIDLFFTHKKLSEK
ncbi:hypothetical protein ACRRTK_010656 [Alexandromys fortis]